MGRGQGHHVLAGHSFGDQGVESGLQCEHRGRLVHDSLLGKVGQIVQGQVTPRAERAEGAVQQGDGDHQPVPLGGQTVPLQGHDIGEAGLLIHDQGADSPERHPKTSQGDHLMQPRRLGRTIGPPAGGGAGRGDQAFPLIDPERLGADPEAPGHFGRPQPLRFHPLTLP